jgi:hypothetical protein
LTPEIKKTKYIWKKMETQTLADRISGEIPEENRQKSGSVYCANCINYRVTGRLFCGFFGLRIEKRLTKILCSPTMKSAVSKVRKRMRCSLQTDFPPIRFPEGGGRKQEGEKK